MVRIGVGVCSNSCAARSSSFSVIRREFRQRQYGARGPRHSRRHRQGQCGLCARLRQRRLDRRRRAAAGRDFRARSRGVPGADRDRGQCAGAGAGHAAVGRRVLPRRVPYRDHRPHQMVAAALSLTQASEAGTIYRIDEIARLSEIAHARSLAVHMDGARFANALVRLNTTPAQMTWQSGIDVLSFGATKGGALAAEAVVVFDPARAAFFGERRKRAGHLLSKHRFIAAQMAAYLADGCWLELARHANAMADRLAQGLKSVGLAPVWPVEANLVFVVLPRALDLKLKAAGADYYVRPSQNLDLGADRVLVRLVTSFATDEAEIERFVNLCKKF